MCYHIPRMYILSEVIILNKVAIVINGPGGVGKDTLCELASRHFKVRNVSSITPIKEIAALCGWRGEKDDKARKFLSDLKALTIEYNDFPTAWALCEFDKFMSSDDEILFVHIREPEEITKFVKATKNKAKTLLVTGGARMTKVVFGNASDDRVCDYSYDYTFVNDKSIQQSEIEFVALINAIFREV